MAEQRRNSIQRHSSIYQVLAEGMAQYEE